MEDKRSDLGFLGVDFQYRLAHHFMDDKKFFRDVSEIVDNNMFTDPNLKKFVGALRDYYRKYEHVPSYELIEIELVSSTKTDQEREFVLSTIDKIKNTTSEGSDGIKDQACKFFKQQNMVVVYNKMGEIIKAGDINRYWELEELIRNAIATGARDEMGIYIKDNLGEVLSDEHRKIIPTGIGMLDKYLEGGIGKGELGLVIGGSGFGKTTLSVAIANYAAYSGYKVVQIFFEDKEIQIQRKHIARMTNIESRNLSKSENIETVKNIISRESVYDKNLILKKFNTGETSPLKIKTYLKRLMNTGFIPDLVVLDYFECLVPSKMIKDQWEGEAHMMRQLESMGADLNVGLWVMTQGSRETMNGDLITLGKGGGSFKKIQISHIVATISRSPDDITNNKATLALLKNRAGQTSPPIEDVEFNNGTCIISTDRCVGYENMDSYKQAELEKDKYLVRDLLKSKKERDARGTVKNDDMPF